MDDHYRQIGNNQMVLQQSKGGKQSYHQTIVAIASTQGSLVKHEAH
ncbi:hypothetical protein SynROS8604_03170 [Synechococcus sp. ROS8604]|nr:hypothetical protein SynROS8604_03170 [Synechococcus sp. ROS8604]